MPVGRTALRGAAPLPRVPRKLCRARARSAAVRGFHLGRRLSGRTVQRVVRRRLGQVAGGLRSEPARAPATRSPAICSTVAPTCARSRSCWGIARLASTQIYTHVSAQPSATGLRPGTSARDMGPGGAARASHAVALGAGLRRVAAGRVRRPGGPPDIEPPRVVAGDSGFRRGARAARCVIPSLTFSEGMEPRSTNDADRARTPGPASASLRWSGSHGARGAGGARCSAHQTYTLVRRVRRARSSRQHASPKGHERGLHRRRLVPPGRIGGRLEAHGFSAGSAYLWCYDEARHHRPDSTGRGLRRPRAWCDQRRTFRRAGSRCPRALPPVGVRRPQRQPLVRAGHRPARVESDTTLSLSAAAPVVDSLSLRIVNPRAPAHVKGTVLDSLASARAT